MSKKSLSARTMRININPETYREDGRDAHKASPATCSLFAGHRVSKNRRNTPYEKLLESVYDAVLITDLRGRTLDFNERAMEFFHVTDEELTGRSVLDMISGADESLLNTIRRNLEAHKFTVIEANCTRSDGTTFPAEIAVNRVDLDSGGQLCIFIRNITVRKQAQQALENAIERLEALDRGRLEFVSNVSHELRTPLTSMIYAVRNMLRGVAGPLPTKAVQYLERLDSDCRRLLGTVNDILDLRQIENSSLTLIKSMVPLGRLLDVGVDSLRVQADEKQVQILLCRSDHDGFVLGDPHKLERVILNIVGNAIKFTPTGGAIRVSLEMEQEAPGEAVIRFCDTGIGIPSEALDKIAVRYFKVGDQPSGSGLGLAISRELVELHGGHLRIASPVPGTDRGTEVKVVLPLTDPPRVLLAVGDDETWKQARETCVIQGCRAQVVRTGREALDLCLADTPDLLVIDHQLPDMPGMDAVASLRNKRRFTRLPIIMLSGEPFARAQLDLLKSFNVPLLPKPLNKQGLARQVASVFLDRGSSLTK